MSSESKDFIKRAIEKGDYKICPKADTASAEWWSTFDRIRDTQGNLKPFVRCRRCLNLLAYDPRKTGTSSLSAHNKTCRATPPDSNQSIITMLERPQPATVSLETKRVLTDSLARLCAQDMRPFEIVIGGGFEHLCQTLLDIGRKNKDRIEARALLPDPTTISRRVQSIAEGERAVTCKRLKVIRM